MACRSQLVSVVFLFSLVFIGLWSVDANPALQIYEKIERGGIKGFPFGPLFCRSTIEAIIGDPLEAFPCTEEPYYVHLQIKNARDYDVDVLPYNTFFESRFGDFFHVRLKEDDTVKPKYIGPVSTHIFPPPEEEGENFRIHMPKKVLHADGKKATFAADYHFEYDIAKNYEYPQSGIYVANPDTPMFLYDTTTKEYRVERLWGTLRHFRVHYVEECYNSRVTVNEIREETEFRGCSEQQVEKISSALSEMRSLATKTQEFLQDVSSTNKRSLLVDWFGTDAASDEAVEKLRSVYDKIEDFIPSVIQCEEAAEYFTEGTGIDDWDYLNSFLYHYYDKDEDEDEEEEIVDPNKVYEIIDDKSGLADTTHPCTIGVTSWLIPRDLSSTIHICPSFFRFDGAEAGSYLMDSVVRFDKIAGAIDYVIGEDFAHTLAHGKDSSICMKNAGSYPIFSRKVSSPEEVVVDASV